MQGNKHQKEQVEADGLLRFLKEIWWCFPLQNVVQQRTWSLRRLQQTTGLQGRDAVFLSIGVQPCPIHLITQEILPVG